MAVTNDQQVIAVSQRWGWFAVPEWCCGIGRRDRAGFTGAEPFGERGDVPVTRRPAQPDPKIRFLHETFVLHNAGKLMDFYDVQRTKLGEGGFGAVHKAKCRKTAAIRAMKTVPKSKIATPETLMVEINILKSLDHPHVVRLVETFEDIANVYLVMELCQGGDFFDAMMQVKAFSEADGAGLLEQMLRAVAYLHEIHVAHRDLKPENFMLVERGVSVTEATLQLIDFGLSKKFTPGQNMISKVGSSFYISPQVIKKQYTHSCDIWSLGVILYILLCGNPPFTGKNDKEIMAKVTTGNVSFHDKAAWAPVSDKGKCMILDMMQELEEKRLTGHLALQQDWIKSKHLHQGNALVTSGLAANLASFKSERALKQAALHAVALQLDDAKIKHLREAFESMDANEDGTLSAKELQVGLEKSGISGLPCDIPRLVEMLDTSGNGAVDYSEFLAGTIDQREYVQEGVLWEAFRGFDKNGDGTISPLELQEVVQDGEVQKALGAAKAQQLMEGIDVNADGVIDFKEFLAMMRNG